MSDDEQTLHQRRGGNHQYADHLSDEEENQYSTMSEIKNEEKTNKFVRNFYSFRMSSGHKKSDAQKFEPLSISKGGLPNSLKKQNNQLLPAKAFLCSDKDYGYGTMQY